MMIDQEYIKHFTNRVKRIRTAIMSKHPFFGCLLMNLRMALDEGIGTAATNGTHIVFAPGFVKNLDDEELTFVFLHELMHIALQHPIRSGSYNRQVFNIAADIVVNSTILNELGKDNFTIDGEEVMHLTPDREEGCLYSAEDVYIMLMKNMPPSGDIGYTTTIDAHSLWDMLTEAKKIEIPRLVADAAATAKTLGGTVPGNVERAIAEYRKSAKLDWRRLLNEFIQVDILDYSFDRPDKRYNDGFILPDLTAVDGEPKNVLFMVDTSASMSQYELGTCFNEIKGAVDQFGGHLSGMLGFFDSSVHPPIPFEMVTDIDKIKPVGGGGTAVDIIFEYISKHMQDNPPSSIVILTDGWVDFPEEPLTDIPVLWVLTCDSFFKPNWGTVIELDLS